MSSTILVTGGAGFIGANFLNASVPARPDLRFVNADKLTYAANLASLSALAQAPNYELAVVDICDADAVDQLFARVQPRVVLHFAAESHVDRSIHAPLLFAHTNVLGTLNLLQSFRAHCADREGARFHHVSSDEVYGALDDGDPAFSEGSPYDPSSPYSASKAASDHFVRAYSRTYGVPITISNCSNNYGPYQFPEKLIPLTILSALERKPIPIYGRGENVRDWLYVADHCAAIWAVLERGRAGETYNVGGRVELRNLDTVRAVCAAVGEQTGAAGAELEQLITFVEDRPGHDRRYAIDPGKLERECGWTARESFATGLHETVRFYLENTAWVAAVRSGEYRTWLDAQYGARLRKAAPGGGS
jgi:dTDP-glucose 4,6-dehydratase